MKIAVDCRYLGKSGIGRVCRGILDNLDYNRHKYYLIGDANALRQYSLAEIIEDNDSPFSVRGILTFPAQVNKLCDCIIIPNFIIPYGIRIPVYTVMHDLIFLDLPKVTTRGFADYRLKKMLIGRCMKKSVSIACVSEFTRSRCAHYYPEHAHKCYVNYVGLSRSVLGFNAAGIQKTNSIVFVGNVKPHKGLSTLISAFHMLPEDRYKLKIIGEREGFLVGMNGDDLESRDVIFTGRLGDEELLKEVASASFLVQPSEYEGFGAPPLEALCLGTRPIISDIPVFREVYGHLPVVFFKVNDAADLRDKIMSADSSMPGGVREEKYSYPLFVQALLSHIEG